MLPSLTICPCTLQVNNLREIQAIKRLSPHPNIVKLEEVLFDPPTGRLALVFELLEGNLYELMKGEVLLTCSTWRRCIKCMSLLTYLQITVFSIDRQEYFGDALVKSFMRQTFTALDHMHGKGVFHRDVKVRQTMIDMFCNAWLQCLSSSHKPCQIARKYPRRYNWKAS